MSSSFKFTPENQKEFTHILSLYPEKRAAMLPTLHLAHQQNGYISSEVEYYVADLLEISIVKVHEVTSFYTLFTERPMGHHHIRLCKSISCWICKADQIEEYLGEKLGISSGEITESGSFSWEAVPECLGACEMAPMMQLGKDYYGPLTPDKVDQILETASQSDNTA